MQLTVGVIQFTPQLGQKEANLQSIEERVAQAADQGAELIVLPEMATTGYVFRNREEIAPHVEPLPGPTTERLARLTREKGIYLAIGLPEVDPATGIFYNSAALLGPEGYVGRYRKTHFWVDDVRWAREGTDPIPVFDTPFGPLGLLICMDASYFEPARLAALQGARLVALVANWVGPVPAHDWRARALENGQYWLVSCREGVEGNTTFSGGSAVVGPSGEILATQPAGDGLLLARLDLDPPAGPPLADLVRRRRPETYAPLLLRPYLWRQALGPFPPPAVSRIGVLRLAATGRTDWVDKSIRQLEDAAESGLQADLWVIPPAATWRAVQSLRDAAGLAEPVPGRLTELMQSWATELGGALVTSLLEWWEGELYFSTVLVTSEQTVPYRYAQLPGELSQWISLGSGQPVTVDLPLGRVALGGGYELLWPERARILAQTGADLIVAPADEDRSEAAILWRQAAHENHSLLAVANGSLVRGAPGSYVYGDRKQEAVDSPREESGALVMRLDTGTRWLREKPLLQMRRPELYDDLVVGGQD